MHSSLQELLANPTNSTAWQFFSPWIYLPPPTVVVLSLVVLYSVVVGSGHVVVVGAVGVVLVVVELSETIKNHDPSTNFSFNLSVNDMLKYH